MRASLLVLALITGLGAAEAFPPPDAADLEQMPLATRLAGDPPPAGLRHWQGFAATDLVGSYTSVVRRDGRIEVWSSTWDEGGAAAHRLVVRSGPALDRLAAPVAAFDGRLIDDVADTAGAAAPARGFTRASMHHDAGNGYVLLGCVCPDYLPGQVPLLPALAASPDGTAGSWRYLGRLRGEPAAEAARARIWSDGGALLPVPGGWRAYLNGYGQALGLAEAADLGGEWRFRRDAQGRIAELLPDFRRITGRTGCFPTVLRAGPADWHAWVCDGWPTQAIWHFWSADGLAWQTYGQQPEITRALVNGRPLKCLRTWVEDGAIAGLLSVWMPTADGEREWRLYLGRMPTGPRAGPPAPGR
jgi:hypothetical protein